MSWQVEYAPRAAKAMRKLDKPVARRIFDALERVAALDDHLPAKLSPGQCQACGVYVWATTA